MIDSMLALGGLGTAPTLPAELAADETVAARRRDLLAAHLAHVEQTAPAQAPAHRAALARAEAHLAWVRQRQGEEGRYHEWVRRHPLTPVRLLRETLYFLGLGKSPFTD